MTPSRVNLYAPRRTAPRLLQVLAFATLAAACLLAGSVTYQVCCRSPKFPRVATSSSPGGGLRLAV